MASGAERRRRQRAREAGELPPLAPDQLPPGTDVPYVPPDLRTPLPWDAWTNGDEQRVDPGEYGLTLSALRRRLHRRAASESKTVTTSRRGPWLDFRFLDG